MRCFVNIAVISGYKTSCNLGATQAVRMDKRHFTVDHQTYWDTCL